MTIMPDARLCTSVGQTCCTCLLELTLSKTVQGNERLPLDCRWPPVKRLCGRLWRS